MNLKNKTQKVNEDLNDLNINVNNLLKLQLKFCKIIHKKSGLFFNGFSNPTYNKGKNTLSPNNYQSILIGNKTDKEILASTFYGHIIEKDGVKSVHNNIVHIGSEVNKILSDYYEDASYIPILDFMVDREL